ncbi:Alpha/Beta hydrolase protein [Hygrophoropsis aurantiaca]|uniref:Alpha/Beta hydrolase protein n=1 Tax=Hygrophoropsis aurantiaca TaxID=72124 RepID=A0ACB8A7E1_9AGAM|nr:Alpha/Beta hydrolase protein [Hygrophoropsis aurantiaca]
MPPNTGTCAFQVGSETYHTWFQIVGDLRSTRTSGIRPLVVLHGGPGMSHHYMLPHTQLHGTHNIPVIFYDQIGNGASTHLPDKPPTFWTLDLFMDELDNLLQFLGVSGEFDLLGHSWGCMLAAHYASHRHPAGMRRLVLVSGAPSMKLWQEGANQLRDKLPKETRDMLEEHERDGTTGDQEYQDAMQAFSNKHICRLVPWPEELLTSFAIMEKEPIVYATMCVFVFCLF